MRLLYAIEPKRPKPLTRIEVYVPGMRYYSPALGRWVNRDPIGERGGVALLQFVKNAPTCRIDRTGLVDVSGVVPSNANHLPHVMQTSLGARGLTVVNGQTGLSAMYASLANLVTCTCKKAATGKFKVACKLRLSLSCKVSGDADASMVNDIYGHEQRHAQNLLAHVSGTVVPHVAAFEGEYECCPSKSDYLALKASTRNLFYNYLVAESNHLHEPFASHPDGAMALLPPLPGTPASLLPNP